MRTRLFLLFILSLTYLLTAQDYTQSFIAIDNTGVEQFRKDFPEYDGRGTVIFIFDTGVDMGVDGLIKTSTGDIKVIDAQDFTGQGDIMFYEADIDDEDDVLYFINEDRNLKVKGAEQLSLEAVDDEYFIGVLPEKLWLNSGSGIKDINGNGSGDDRFHFVTFKAQESNKQFWVLYFDTDYDGDLSDETGYRNYKGSLQPMFIETGDNLPLLTFAINIFPEEQKVNFFFDDGSHGTHCAGIASGYNIGDNGFNGVAPGANIIACKIGNNNFSGGATVTESMKRAFLYADKYSKQLQKPCIISMSYGIGSEIEGHSVMEKFIGKLVAENPYLYMSLSNSNEGPGISSTGLPSATSNVFSTGAVLTKEVAADVYGASLDKDIILHFSSRGGAVLKPDIVAPGAAIATVPNHAGGDRMWGTSMAAPYSSGVLSLLLSAANAEFPGIKIPSLMLYGILCESAVPMDGYTYVDQGGGYVNVPEAWKLLRSKIESGEVEKFETYTVSTFAPNMPGQKAPGLYIRNGLFLNGNETFTYKISRNNFMNCRKFYRTYNLKSDSDWLIPAQRKLHIRNDQSASVDVSFDKSILTEPGLYNGKIYARRADKSDNLEFELMATVVIPYIFDSHNNYINSWENVSVDPGDHKRYFLRIPAGTGNIRIKINSDANEFTHVRYYLHDNDGRNILSGVFDAGMNEDSHEEFYMNPDPGVYELDIVGYYTDKTNSIYDLVMDIDGLNILNEQVLKPGENDIKIINLFDEVKECNVSGEITGYRQIHNITVNAGESYELPFKFDEGDNEIKFDMELTKEDYNKLTDFAVVIYDKDGKAVKSNSFNYRFADIKLKNKPGKDNTYTLKLIPGFAEKENSINIKLVQQITYSNKLQADIINKQLTFYPTAVQKIKLNIIKPDSVIPEDAQYCGKLYLSNPGTDKIETEFNLLLNK